MNVRELAPGAIFDSVESLVGNTPVVHLARFASNSKDSILAKCEFLNPGGSVKDRIAFYMVQKAEEEGALRPGGTIVEATAGNTGVGLAVVAAVRGYKLITVMSSKVSSDKVGLLKALGVETVIVPAGKSIGDPDHALNRARQIAKERGAWLADQFFNGANVQTHYETTGPEIWQQTGGAVDVLVAGVGTGGTLSGAGKYLKERKPSVRVVLADPVGSLLADLVRGNEDGKSGSYIVEGIGQDFVPGNFDKSIVDDVVQVTDEQSIKAAHRLFAEEGLFVGSSSGCILHAAVEASNRLQGKNLNIIAILPDGGRGYLSTIYNGEWLNKNGFSI